MATIDEEPPEVCISNIPLRAGRSYVTYTYGEKKRILIHSGAVSLFSENELNAVILKKYFEIRRKDALKFVYTSNLATIAFVDGVIIPVVLSTFLNSQTFISYVFIAVTLVSVVLIAPLPYIIRALMKRKEISSDLASVRLSGDSENLKSYITKALENYKPSPLMTDKRVRKLMGKQDLYRVHRIESSGFGR